MAAGASSSRTDWAACGDDFPGEIVAASTSSSGRRARASSSACRIGEIESKRSDRDPALFDRPAIGAFIGAFDWCHRGPEERASRGILCRHDLAVVPPHRGTRPDHSARLPRKVDVHELEIAFGEQRLQHLANPRLQRLEVRRGFRSGWYAQCHTAQTKQCRLLGCCDCS